MEPTIGKALRDARLEQGLTPEEVAKATKIREDWIIDLENEDYHRFPSLGYARNFQILYAKHLGIDIQQTTMVDPGRRTLKTSFDHIYEGVTPMGYRGMRRARPIQRSRWIFALIVFSVTCVIAAIIALFILDILRLPNWDEMMGDDSQKREERLVVPPAVEPSPDAAAPSPQTTPTPAEELPPLADDGTMHPPLDDAPLPPLFAPSPALESLIKEAGRQTPAEPFRMVPPSPSPLTLGSETGLSAPFAADAEALSTPFPSGWPEASPSASPAPTLTP